MCRKLDIKALERMIEDATVDAYTGSEQRVGFYAMIDEHLRLPFETMLLGINISVRKIDMSDTEEIVAVCHQGLEKLKVPILDLPLPDPPPAGSEWIDAYRHWIC